MPKDEKIYYHGTWDGYAYAVMSQGFRLGQRYHGRRLGRGLYISQSLASSVFWSHSTVFKCRLQPGTRILWIHEGYDKSVIAHLRREFGQELLDLGPQFDRAIPKNKQLTRRELVHLCNYIYEVRSKKQWRYALSRSKRKRAKYWGAWERLSRLREHVRRHDFDAIGDRSYEHWDSDEILVFNPSRVTPLSAHRLYSDEDMNVTAISEPLTLAELAAISTRALEEEE